MANILIIGSKGQLGSELRLISRRNFGLEYFFKDIEDIDITDASETKLVIGKIRPDWIINCAAYNQVDKAETETEEAMKINGTAVKNIVDVIRDTSCHLIHISTDYVFNGRAKAPYSEYVIPDPLSVYGKSKLAGEKNALMHPWTMVIRTSWLYSSYGNNFVKTILRLGKEKKELKVVNDQTGTPTYAADLAEAIMSIIARVNRQQLAFNAGIYHYSNEGSCNWYEFAVAILEEAGISCQVKPVSSEEYKSAARRPAYSVLNKNKIIENYGLTIPAWRTSLGKCIKVIKKNS
jgi:dTDP-4-dehydrorhamnose reductase